MPNLESVKVFDRRIGVGSLQAIKWVVSLADRITSVQRGELNNTFGSAHKQLSSLTASLLEKESLFKLSEETREQRIGDFRRLALYSPDWLRALILIKPANSWDGRLLVEALVVDDHFLVQTAQDEIIHRFQVAGREKVEPNIKRVKKILRATQYEWRFDRTGLIEPMVEFIANKDNLHLFGGFFELIRGEALIRELETKLLTLEDDGIISEELKKRLFRRLELAMEETEAEEWQGRVNIIS